MKVQEIREVIQLIDQSDIDEFVYEQEGLKLELRKKEMQVLQQPVSTNTTETYTQHMAFEEVQEERSGDKKVANEMEQSNKAEKTDQDNLLEVVSPMVGTFYEAASPESDPYVKVGSVVQSDTVVCIVEAMKLFNEIEAEAEGEIIEILVKDGELVEYGQPLFLIKPS